MSDSSATNELWTNRKIIVAITGGIACYKIGTLVSGLVQHGALVRVLMTEAATHFNLNSMHEQRQDAAHSLWAYLLRLKCLQK